MELKRLSLGPLPELLTAVAKDQMNSQLTFEPFLASWALDDWPPFHADPSRPGAQGYVSPDSIAASWKDSFTYCYNHYDTFIFPMSIHPQVSGMPHILMMHDR